MVELQQLFEIPPSLGCAVLLARLELCAQVGALLLTPERHQPAAERLLLALVARKSGGDVAMGQRVSEARRIEGGLGHARPDVGPRYESGIAEQRHASEHHVRRRQLEDRL